MKIFTRVPTGHFVEVSAAQYPDIRAENRVFGWILLLALPALLVIAALYLYLGSPASDSLHIGVLGRMRAVRGFYADPPADAREKQLVLGLGDSVTIYAFDGETFDRLAGPRGYVGYNLALPAKGMCEFLADISQPIAQRAQVVCFVNPLSTFAAREVELQQRKANMLRLLDYPLDQPLWSGYSAAVPDSGIDYLLEPRYVHIMDSRWRLVENAVTSFKLASPLTSAETKHNLLELEHQYGTNLKYPVMPIKGGDKRVQHNLDVRAKEDPELFTGGFHPSEASLAAFGYMVREVSSRSQGLVLVMAPLHPLLRERIGAEGLDEYRQIVADQQGAKVRLLDFSDMLGDEDFRDDVHLSAEGARKVTERLCQELGYAEEQD